MTHVKISQKNSATPVCGSPTATSGNSSKKRYTARKDPIAQLRALAGPYLRHGAKEHRRKRLRQLERAVRATTTVFRNNDLRQIGKRHVHWWYNQLREQGRSDKTLSAYFYAWELLWEILNRTGTPPRPK